GETAKKAAGKGSNKGKWQPLDAEIQYPKPKNATAASNAHRQPKQQTGGNRGSSTSNAAGHRHPKDGSKQAKTDGKSSDSDGKPQHKGHGKGAHKAHTNGSQAEGSTQQSQRQSRSSGRGRGRGRGQSHSNQQGRRTGSGPNHQQQRTAGHAPSHYHGKGNVQPGSFVPAPLPVPVPGDEESVKQFVKAQVEYYFSVDNLCKDIFFRTQMDPDGYVPLKLISEFNRVKKATEDLDLIRSALDSSTEVVLNAARDRVRKQKDWKTWLFPKQEVVQQQKQQNDALKSE
ncbi:hypothetical protein EC988_008553, partial [Linderina pennispora]